MRRVLRRGSKKGLSGRHLEGRNMPYREYAPFACTLQSYIEGKRLQNILQWDRANVVDIVESQIWSNRGFGSIFLSYFPGKKTAEPKGLLMVVSKRWFEILSGELTLLIPFCDPLLPQRYLILTSCLPLFYLNLTSAPLEISNRGLETTVYRPLENAEFTKSFGAPSSGLFFCQIFGRESQIH